MYKGIYSLLQEATRNLKDLKEALKKQEAEIEKLRNENDSMKNKERENISVIGRQERIIIEEINRECQKTAEVLGVTARKTSVPASVLSLQLHSIEDTFFVFPI